jgi:NADH:ubiquinone oxidoreductase subunit E
MQRSDLRPILQDKFPRERTYLLPALHYLQHEFGYLPEWALQIVSWHLRIPASEVYGAATSYSELRMEEPGQHVVRVCTGLSCWYGGGKELWESLHKRWGDESGDGDSSKETTLEETPCGFLCPMAPAIEIDGRWHGRVTPESLAHLVQGLGD